MATMEQRQDGAFIETPHDKTVDFHGASWAMTSTVVYRDWLGRAGTTTAWLVFTCVGRHCPAVALVRESVFTQQVRGLLPTPPVGQETA